MKKIFIPIILCSYWLACDKYSGYSYEAESLVERTRIFGTIENIYTGEPVYNALISIGNYASTTTRSGEYNIDYLLGVDESRNRPIAVRVTAKNYFVLDTTLILFPDDTQFDLKLYYGAPIFNAVYIGMPRQSQVTDFQGIDDIASVSTTFFYTVPGEPGFRTVEVQMRKARNISSISAYYQVPDEPDVPPDWIPYDADKRYEFTAIDRYPFFTTVTERNDALQSPILLFPPVVF